MKKTIKKSICDTALATVLLLAAQSINTGACAQTHGQASAKTQTKSQVQKQSQKQAAAGGMTSAGKADKGGRGNGQDNREFFDDLLQHGTAQGPVLKAREESEWVFYADVRAGGAQTMADIALNEVIEPDPRLYAVEIALPKGPESGLWSRQIVTSWPKGDQPLLCGTKEEKTSLKVWAYCTDTTQTRKTLAQMKWPGGVKPAYIRHKKDPTWQTFADLLMPTNPQLQEIANKSWTEQMKAKGDDPEKMHTFAHEASFETSKGREAFRTKVAQMGYTVKGMSSRAGERPYIISFGSKGKTSLEEMNKMTDHLWQAAEENGGSYDKYETSVAR